MSDQPTRPDHAGPVAAGRLVRRDLAVLPDRPAARRLGAPRRPSRGVARHGRRRSPFGAVYIWRCASGMRRDRRGSSVTAAAAPRRWSALVVLVAPRRRDGACARPGGTRLRGLHRGRRVMMLPLRGRGAARGRAIAALGVVARRPVPGWDSQDRHGLRASAPRPSRSSGMQPMMTRNIELLAAHEENAEPRRRERAQPVRPRPARHPRPLADRDHGQGRAGQQAARRRPGARPRRARRPRAALAATRWPTYAGPWRATAS